MQVKLTVYGPGIVSTVNYRLVSNYPPEFGYPGLNDKFVRVKESLRYKLPPLVDRDSGQMPAILSVTMSYTPPFFTYDRLQREIVFKPTNMKQADTHIVLIEVTDFI